MSGWKKKETESKGPDRGKDPVVSVSGPKKLKVYFQRLPGKVAKSGIEGASWVATADGKEISKGKTGPDGLVELDVPATGATLKIFDTEFTIKPLARMEAIQLVSDVDVFKRSVRRRLVMLGYETGSLDGALTNLASEAMLNFALDSGEMLRLGEEFEFLDSAVGGKLDKQAGT